MKAQKTKATKAPKTADQGIRTPVPEVLDEQARAEQKLKLQTEITEIYQTLVEKPKNAQVDLQIRLTVIEKLLNDAMDERAKGAKDIGARIKVQAEEAKIMTTKQLKILQEKTKLEKKMEKETMKRFNDLKAAVNKVKQIVESNEKNIQSLKNKRRSEGLKVEKMLETLVKKETQAKLKRERAEAVMNSSEILLKEKTLQKIFIQKQMNKIEKVEVQIQQSINPKT